MLGRNAIGGEYMRKWLVDKCRESEVFACGAMVVGIGLMILIALI